ncbi:MAG: LLM class flavin-dependent oxidoreductase [Alphaproteobacteria bacterium]|nr:LLM class flavin-dependent oxidoreductase [Alphaproteobacteria bacterium]
MKFDIFCEIQRAEPWPADHEASLFRETLEQAEAADAAGFDVWWEVEHHSAPAFSYSSAPALVLAAIAMRTKRIHVGHAGVLAPFRINNPYRVAEAAATLDVLSGGRLELGLAKSGGKEWETFGVDPEKARDQVREGFSVISRFWTEDQVSWNSPDFVIPARDCIPKPLQKPHPRLWQTCGSPESFRMAGEMGVGCLGTTLLSPVSFMGQMIQEHEAGLAACRPAGKTINREKGIFTFVHVADTREAAIRNGAALAALWYVHAAPIIFKVPRAVWYDAIRAGLHPNSARSTAALTGSDETSLDIAPDELPVLRLLKLMARGESVSKEEAHDVLEQLDSVVIGDVDHCRDKLEAYRNIGTDRMMCLMQFGAIPHAAVLRSMALTGEHLIPHFARGEAAALRA